MSSTIVRFWWAFGEEIGGRHLREMLRTSAEGKPLAVPADCGGSFLSQDDFNLAVETILQRPATAGRVFNLASAYVTWDDVARMVMEVTGDEGIDWCRARAGRAPPSSPTAGSWTTAGSGSSWASSRVESRPEFGTPCNRRSARRGGASGRGYRDPIGLAVIG
jgi:nucleoside-diphosphate-sugar epimerase